MPTYAQLKTQHPEYAARVATWCTLDDLYEGGFRITQNADAYIPAMSGETAVRYRERKRSASYVNHFGTILDHIGAQLFAAGLKVRPATGSAATPSSSDDFWATFARDADRRGTPFAMVLREVFGTALLKGRGVLGADFPLVAEQPTTRAEEDAVGAARGYAFSIDPEQLIDWAHDDDGRIAFAVLYRQIGARRADIGEGDAIADEFKVWRREGTRVAWEVYRTPPRARSASGPRDTDEIPLVASGTASFDEVPLLELTLPHGLWLGNKLGPLAIEHFVGRSALNAGVNRSLFSIPYVKLGPEIGAFGGASPAEAAQDPARGDDPVGKFQRMGFLTLGKDDDLGYAEPGGGALQLRADLLRDLVHDMFSTAVQAAASIATTKSASALGASGRSKAQDWRATELLLETYGAIVRDFAVRVHGLIARARGEAIAWSAEGLDEFDVDSTLDMLTEATQLAGLSIPSKTFAREHKTQLALAVLRDVAPETKDAIRKEIAEGVDVADKPAPVPTVRVGDTSPARKENQ